MYTIKKINGAEVLHNNNDPVTCPYAMAAVPITTTLGQMQVIPINRECSSRCALFEMESINIKLHCTCRLIKVNIDNWNLNKTL